MSFDPVEYLKVSNELLAGNTEAHYRSLINRAYYPAFGHIRNKLSISNNRGSVHREVILRLKTSRLLEEAKAGAALELLFKRRKECDYDHHKPVKSYQCEYNIREAEKIIELFNQSRLAI